MDSEDPESERSVKYMEKSGGVKGGEGEMPNTIPNTSADQINQTTHSKLQNPFKHSEGLDKSQQNLSAIDQNQLGFLKKDLEAPEIKEPDQTHKTPYWSNYEQSKIQEIVEKSKERK